MPAQSTVAGRPKPIAYVLGVFSWTVFVTVVELLDDGDGRGGAIAILISLGPLAMGFLVATWSYWP